MTFNLHGGGLHPKYRVMVLTQKRLDCPLQVGEDLLPQLEESKYLRVLFTSQGSQGKELRHPGWSKSRALSGDHGGDTRGHLVIMFQPCPAGIRLQERSRTPWRDYFSVHPL